MKRSMMAIAAAATLAVSALAAPAPAHAQRGVAAGVAAGLIGGAIVGGALASHAGYYGGRGHRPAAGALGCAGGVHVARALGRGGLILSLCAPSAADILGAPV